MTDPERQAQLLGGWLGGLPSDLTAAFLQEGRSRRFIDGDRIFNQGDEDQGLFGIADGHVRMFFTMNEQDPLLGHIAGPGFWFGEGALLLGTGRLMGAEASGPTELWFTPLTTIERIAANEPAVWRAIARLAALNGALAIGAAEDLMIRGSRQRLVAVLFRLANRRNAFQGVRPILNVPVSQPELAEAACLSRTATTQILREFGLLGWIETGYRSIRILEPEQLSSVLRN